MRLAFSAKPLAPVFALLILKPVWDDSVIFTWLVCVSDNEFRKAKKIKVFLNSLKGDKIH